MRVQNIRNQFFLRCEKLVKKLSEVRCTHRLELSQNLTHIETELQLQAVVEIATNLQY